MQKRYENNDIDFMTKEEIEKLKLFYNRKEERLKKDLDNKKTTLNILKMQIKKYVEETT